MTTVTNLQLRLPRNISLATPLSGSGWKLAASVHLSTQQKLIWDLFRDDQQPDVGTLGWTAYGLHKMSDNAAELLCPTLIDHRAK